MDVNQMEMTSASDTSDSVTLKLRILKSASYCYTLTASNDSNTVIVKGQIGKNENRMPIL